MEDNIYRNKYAVRSTIGEIKVLKKLDRIKEEEAARIKPEIEAYKASKEYEKLLEELKKKDEDDEYRNDTDPKGYELYEKAIKDPIGKALEMAVLIAKTNDSAKDLHAKVIPIFLQKSNVHILIMII